MPNDYKHVYDYFGIESTSAKDVSDALDAANGQPLEVYINSGGGYVGRQRNLYPARGVRRRCEYQDYLCRQRRQHHCHGWAQRNFPVGQLMIHNVASTAEGDYRAMHHAGDVLETANDPSPTPICGSGKPATKPRNDGRGNVITAQCR